MTTVTYEIAGVRIRMELPAPVEESEAFAFYRVPNGGAPAVCLTVEADAALTESDAPLLYATAEMHVRREETGDARYFFDGARVPGAPYAVLQGGGTSRMRLRYHPAMAAAVAYIGGIFHCLGLEQVLLDGGAVILHSSYVQLPGGALLFTGPSGIGKSTQAALWERCAGARLVNGDRTGLRRTEGGFAACGLPYAGSSRCFRNVTLPLRAIVRLEQAPGDTVESLSPAEGFPYLYEQTTVNVWNAGAVRRTVDLVGALCESVPLYRLACTDRPSAVETLRAALTADGVSLW